MEAEFLKELFYDNPYNTDDQGYRYYVIESFNHVYSLKVDYNAMADRYVVISWKNESL